MININKLNGGNIVINTGATKTRITFADGTTEEYDWSGEINEQQLENSGLKSGSVWNKNPRSIFFGTSVSSIDYSTFSQLDELTSIFVPDSVTTIDEGAFSFCSNLSIVQIDGGENTSIGAGCFSGCTAMADENGFIIVNDIAFGTYNNTYSGTLTFPEVKRLDEGFNLYTSSELRTVIIPSSVDYISDEYMFYNIMSLSSVVFQGKTLAQVRAMDGYPWGITNTSIISVSN